MSIFINIDNIRYNADQIDRYQPSSVGDKHAISITFKDLSLKGYIKEVFGSESERDAYLDWMDRILGVFKKNNIEQAKFIKLKG